MYGKQATHGTSGKREEPMVWRAASDSQIHSLQPGEVALLPAQQPVTLRLKHDSLPMALTIPPQQEGHLSYEQQLTHWIEACTWVSRPLADRNEQIHLSITASLGRFHHARTTCTYPSCHRPEWARNFSLQKHVHLAPSGLVN